MRRLRSVSTNPILPGISTADIVQQWHLFYIDTNNAIRERINNNVTNLWSDGPINDLDIKAMDSPNVGLQACWYGSFYGDAQYKHSPVPGQNETDQNNADQSAGIHLWYGDTGTSFQEFGWAYGNSYWQPEDRAFEGYNGHAGVGCYTVCDARSTLSYNSIDFRRGAC